MQEHDGNETGNAEVLTAVLPRDDQPLKFGPMTAVEAIELMVYEVERDMFALIRRHNPNHVQAKYTYFARCSETGNIKIGRSFDPAFRMKSITNKTKSQHELLATVRGGENEGSYHACFYQCRLHGEWFAPHPDLLAEIERLSRLSLPPAGEGGVL